MSNNSSGLSVCSVLTIVFIVLKCVGVITWEWKWVLCPTWIPICISLLILLFMWLFKD